MKVLLRAARLGCYVVFVALCLRSLLLLLTVPAVLTGDRDAESPPDGKWSNGFAAHRDRLYNSIDVQRILQAMRKDYPCQKNVSRPRDMQSVHTRNEFWQLHDIDSTKNEVLVYSAFYDDRPDTGVLPVLRVLGVANNAHDTLYCQIWFEELELPYIVPVQVLKNGRGDRFNGIAYGQHMYTCSLASVYPVPTHVSLTTQECETPSTFLPIVRSIRSNWEEEFAVCVPIAFGNMDWADLITWFEMMRILGVNHVHVYNGSFVPELRTLFDYYHQQGLATVHQMPPPVHNAFTKRGAKLGSPASLNDCMLRYMYKYRYLIVIDFDEVIVPRTASNYSSLLQAINRKYNLKVDPPSYTFRNIYYFLDHPGDPKESNNFKFFKYRTRQEPSGYLFASKSMINPRHCLSVFNHYCYIRFPSTGKKWTIDVPPEFAGSHHYRHCGFSKPKCEEMAKTQTKDNVIMRFKDRVLSAAETSLKMLGR